MFKKILVGVSEYSISEVAGRYAIALAKETGAKLYLLHVDEKGKSNGSLHRAKEVIDRLFISAKKEMVEVECLIKSGFPFEELQKFVREEKIDILFTAMRSDKLKKRSFSKTLSKRLMEHLPCAVAVVRAVNLGRIRPHNILVYLRYRLVDLEERAHFVGSLAKGFQAKVTLFWFNGAWMVSSLCKAFAKKLEEMGIPHEKKRGRGEVAWAVRFEAAHKRSDLIIITLGKTTFWGSLFRKHPLDALLRHPPCNLIIFKKGAA